MGDAQVRDMLRASWETITTEGLNKMEPGQFRGTGARANRGSDSRQIHFADGEAWLAYMKQFGGGTLYDAMMSHVGGMTRDIALVERYGPDIQSNARLQFDLAGKADGRSPDKLAGPLEISPQTYWNLITGKTGMAADENLAQAFKWARDIQSAAKLGAAVITSVTDLGTLAITTGYNRLPYWQLVKDIGSQASKETRDWMSAHGMIAESAANALNRWSGDHLGNGWSGRLSNATMRVSFMNAWTDGLRQGFVLTMNAKLGQMAKSEWSALSEFDRSRFARAGIGEDDWKALQGVQLEQFKGRELLTPQGIKEAGHLELAKKVFGLIHDEAEYAVVNPDLATRAVISGGGLQAGTWGGELARTVMQFKSFPIAMFTRHWDRLLHDPMPQGALPPAGQPRRLRLRPHGHAPGAGCGRDAGKAAPARQGPDRHEQGALLGQGHGARRRLRHRGRPVPGRPEQQPGRCSVQRREEPAGPDLRLRVRTAVQGPVREHLAGHRRQGHALGRGAASWARNNVPSVANVWWVRPMVDHGFMNALNESMSPGYLAQDEAARVQGLGQQVLLESQRAAALARPGFFSGAAMKNKVSSGPASRALALLGVNEAGAPAAPPPRPGRSLRVITWRDRHGKSHCRP
jgi:hypothetical protein